MLYSLTYSAFVNVICWEVMNMNNTDKCPHRANYTQSLKTIAQCKQQYMEF